MDYISKSDLEILNNHQINASKLSSQVELITAGENFLKLGKPALKENGRILEIAQSEFPELIKTADEEITPSLIKFVPASGAASRMFKALNFVYNNNFETIDLIDQELSKSDNKEVVSNLNLFKTFWEKLPTFPFAEELKILLKNNGLVFDQEYKSGKISSVLKYLLTDKGMNYSNKPKLLLTFHLDESNPRLAIEEHIKEAVMLTGGKVHFTVTPSHLKAAKEAVEYISEEYKREGHKLEVSFSIQSKSTDVVAVEPDFSDFHRNKDGSLFFRQSGHGALIRNLNQIEEKYALVQNVDNLPGGSDSIIKWKKAFIGYFGKIEREVFDWVNKLSDEGGLSEQLVDEAYKYITDKLKRPVDDASFSECDLVAKANTLLNSINRPIVLAAMVPNKGEPGGGPFAVVDEKTGLTSNQIVEGAQQDKCDSAQVEIIKKSTHFNPVFMILNTKDAFGKKFDLEKYSRDEKGYVFYVEKSDSEGNKFASIDTGLWNGKIADMLVLFIEMPIETFGPAKTVVDLSPEIRPFRNNPYPEIVPAVSHEKIISLVDQYLGKEEKEESFVSNASCKDVDLDKLNQELSEVFKR